MYANFPVLTFCKLLYVKLFTKLTKWYKVSCCGEGVHAYSSEKLSTSERKRSIKLRCRPVAQYASPPKLYPSERREFSSTIDETLSRVHAAQRRGGWDKTTKITVPKPVS